MMAATSYQKTISLLNSGYPIAKSIKKIVSAIKPEVLLVLKEKLLQTIYQRNILIDRLHKIEQVQAVTTLIESCVLTKPICTKRSHGQIER
jgi:hypothetical protein